MIESVSQNGGIRHWRDGGLPSAGKLLQAASRGSRVSSGISWSRRGCSKKEKVVSSVNLRIRFWREIAQQAVERLAAVRLYLAGE